MMNGLSSFLMSPWLAVLGLLAIASPILIHLLNRRRFKIVDWAAMEFLRDADKKNRRRVRLEDLLLLLLRCLAVFLLGLLLARPFFESALTAALFDGQPFQRIVLLDDSLSMQTRTDNQSAMDRAKRSLIGIVRALAANSSDDQLTVLLTSHPDAPLIGSERVTEAAVEQLAATIEQVEPCDRTADLDAAFQEILRYLASEKPNVNRALYIITDLREHDWQLADKTADQNAPARLLQRLAKQTNACFLVDVGDEQSSNLVVTEIKPEGTLVAGVASRFDVTVANLGGRAVEQVRVRFLAGDSLPLEEEIGRLEAGRTETVPFNFTFALEQFQDDSGEASGGGQLPRHRAPYPVRVTAQVVAGRAAAQDRLAADSERFFAARVAGGIPTLIVDGDPSAVYGHSESFYLKPALAPPGDARSGLAVDVATDTELGTITLSEYQVIFLCNVYRVSADRARALQRWTAAGGGLVLMPGDQVDEDVFNDRFFQDGKGLSPLRLEGFRGDETHRTWVNFHLVVDHHPALRVFEGQNNPFLDRVKIFRWWGSTLVASQPDSAVSVLARLTDEEDSPVMVEKAFGRGRVMAMTIPADADWTNWPDDYCFLVTMQELVRYLAGDSSGDGQLRVGQPLRQAVDLVQYRPNATLRLPDDQQVNVQAVHLPGDGASAAAAVRRIEYPETDRRGFYQLELTRTSGGREPMLFAANIDPREGNLRPLGDAGRRRLASGNVRIVGGDAAAAQTVRGSRREFWKPLLVAVMIVLCAEQLLGWVFGRRR